MERELIDAIKALIVECGCNDYVSLSRFVEVYSGHDVETICHTDEFRSLEKLVLKYKRQERERAKEEKSKK